MERCGLNKAIHVIPIPESMGRDLLVSKSNIWI